MPLHSLTFLSVDEAEAFIPEQPTVAISIVSPGRQAARLHPELRDILRLEFHDAVPTPSKAENVVCFSPDHAHAIIDFLRRHQADAEPHHLLIHCEAGISRSAAVAVFAASECRLPLSGQFAFLNLWVLGTLVRVAYPHYAFDLFPGSD